MMSGWTHPICQQCYSREEPNRAPYRFSIPLVETCCFCSLPTQSGIYYRRDPALTPCGGAGKTHEEDDE